MSLPGDVGYSQAAAPQHLSLDVANNNGPAVYLCTTAFETAKYMTTTSCTR